MGYTLGQAAKAVGKSRTAIHNAVKTGKISAEKTVHGHWSIEPAELHRVYPPAVHPDSTDSENGTLRNTGVNNENSLLEARFEAAEEKLRLQDDLIEDLRVQRDKWQEHAAHAQRLLERQSYAEPRRLTWAERLTGKLVGAGRPDPKKEDPEN